MAQPEQPKKAIAAMAGLRFTDYFSLGDEFQENPMVKAGSRLVMETFWARKLDLGCQGPDGLPHKGNTTFCDAEGAVVVS